MVLVLYLVFSLFLILMSCVSAADRYALQSSFVNGSSVFAAPNITFQDKVNISLPINSTVVSASLNVSGERWNCLDYVLQAAGNGVYGVNNQWRNDNTAARMDDDDFNTAAEDNSSIGGGAVAYLNYSLPSYVSSQSLLEVRNTGENVNVSVGAACFDRGLYEFKVAHTNVVFGSDSLYISCIDASSSTYKVYSAVDVAKLYELSMYWCNSSFANSSKIYFNGQLLYDNSTTHNFTVSIALNVSLFSSMNQLNFTQESDYGRWNVSSLAVYYHVPVGLSYSGLPNYNNTINLSRSFNLTLSHVSNQSFNYSLTSLNTGASNFSLNFSSDWVVLDGNVSGQVVVSISKNASLANGNYTLFINVTNVNTSGNVLFPIYLEASSAASPELYWQDVGSVGLSITEGDSISLSKLVNDSVLDCNDLSVFSSGLLSGYLGLNVSSFAIGSRNVSFIFGNVPAGGYAENVFLRCNVPSVISQNSFSLALAVAGRSSGGSGGGGGGVTINDSLSLFPAYFDTFFIYPAFLSDNITFVRKLDADHLLRSCESVLFDCRVDGYSLYLTYRPVNNNQFWVVVEDEVVVYGVVGQRLVVPIRLTVINPAVYVPLGLNFQSGSNFFLMARDGRVVGLFLWLPLLVLGLLGLWLWRLSGVL